MTPIKTGLFIKNKRLEKALTQEELAERLNVSKNTVSRWERGINFPDYGIIEKLSIELGCSVSAIIRGEEYQCTDDSTKGVFCVKQSEGQYKLHKIRLYLLCALLFGIIVLIDLTYGYFTTNLYWQINGKTFYPKGLFLSLIFNQTHIINDKGILLTKAALVFLGWIVIMLLLVTAIVIISIKEKCIEEGNKEEG